MRRGKSRWSPACANTPAYHMDGGGDSDVITRLAHNYRIRWFEQLVETDGPVLKQRKIFNKCSQTHAINLADVSSGGLKDFVTGK
jgi:hypothetical protein